MSETKSNFNRANLSQAMHELESTDQATCILSEEGEVELVRDIEEGKQEILHALLKNPVSVHTMIDIVNELKQNATAAKDVFDLDLGQEINVSTLKVALENLKNIQTMYYGEINKSCKPSENIESSYQNALQNVHGILNEGTHLSAVAIHRILQEVYKVQAEVKSEGSQILSQFSNLPTQEFMALTSELKQLDDKVTQSKEALTDASLPIVHSVAKEYLNKGIDSLDLIKEGKSGLEQAVDKFQPKAGFKFTTCATWWINQSIKSAIAELSA